MNYCQSHQYSIARRLTRERHWVEYSVRQPNPNITPVQGRRYLGDVVALHDAIGFLQNYDPALFNNNIYRDHPNIIQHYFAPPYNADLQQAFGLPFGGV
jgi:hypothetical protein